MKYLVGLVTFFTLSINLFSQAHWETIVHANFSWAYFPATSEPASSWHLSSFDDSAWPTGKGGIGYGDGDDSTVISAVNSLYLRQKFDVLFIDSVYQLILDIDYDDAFIAYLNGTEVARSGNIDGSFPAFDATINWGHEARMYSGGIPERFFIDVAQLVQGENLLAIHILNHGIGSSDLSSNIFLNAEINSKDITYQVVPDWFAIPGDLTTCNLPIIKINTSGQEIPDEPKITATMQVINNSSGINNLYDTATGYNGYIGIEKRGSSSQYFFDKYNYTVETRLATGENNNVSLLGMPEENDWVFHGPYSDKSLIRNNLAYFLANINGRWAPRTKFFELFINDQYVGVYLLVEKIKRDKNRVNIAKLNPDEITGDDLTGGYILKVDRVDNFWTSPYKDMHNNHDIEIGYVYPDYDEMPSEQRNYIKTYVTLFETALSADNFDDPANGYQAYADLQSFVDFFIVNEISKNIDAYRLSTFMHKDKDSKGGKLTMGPVWDFNLGFGNANYYNGFETHGWVIHEVDMEDQFSIPFWWERLRESVYFNSRLRTTWETLRTGKYSNAVLHNYIDTQAELLYEAQERNFQVNSVMGSWIWPNYFVGQNYQEEIDYLKTWIDDRLAWMDNQIEQLSFTNSLAEEIANSYEIYAYPNPFTEYITFRINLKKSADLKVSIYNLLGQEMYVSERPGSFGINEFRLDNELISFESGIYIYKIQSGNIILQQGKIIKN